MSPFAETLPILDALQERIGSSPNKIFQARDVDDGPVSPSSSPHRSALTTRSRRPRFSLGPVEEEKVVQLQSHEGKDAHLITASQLTTALARLFSRILG